MSASRRLLVLPRHRLRTYGRRAFSVAGPSAWNSLPDNLRDSSVSRDSFCKLLKSYLFTLYWNMERIRGFTRMRCMRYTNLYLLTYLRTYLLIQVFIVLYCYVYTDYIDQSINQSINRSINEVHIDTDEAAAVDYRSHDESFCRSSRHYGNLSRTCNGNCRPCWRTWHGTGDTADILHTRWCLLYTPWTIKKRATLFSIITPVLRARFLSFLNQ